MSGQLLLERAKWYLVRLFQGHEEFPSFHFHRRESCQICSAWESSKWYLDPGWFIFVNDEILWAWPDFSVTLQNFCVLQVFFYLQRDFLTLNKFVPRLFKPSFTIRRVPGLARLPAIYFLGLFSESVWTFSGKGQNSSKKLGITGQIFSDFFLWLGCIVSNLVKVYTLRPYPQLRYWAYSLSVYLDGLQNEYSKQTIFFRQVNLHLTRPGKFVPGPPGTFPVFPMTSLGLSRTHQMTPSHRIAKLKAETFHYKHCAIKIQSSVCYRVSFAQIRESPWLNYIYYYVCVSVC